MKIYKFAKFVREKFIGTLCFFLMILILLAVYGCKTNDSDLYKKGVTDGEKKAFMKVYLDSNSSKFQAGLKYGFQQGVEFGYQKGKKEGKLEGMRLGIEIGFKKGREEGYKEGTMAFINKWWKPSLGLIILLLASGFIVTVILMFSRKKINKIAVQSVEKIENSIVGIRMEREIKKEDK